MFYLTDGILLNMKRSTAANCCMLMFQREVSNGFVSKATVPATHRQTELKQNESHHVNNSTHTKNGPSLMLPRTGNSFKWLAEKIDTDMKEVRLNFNYFKQNVQNIPFAIVQIEPEAVQDAEKIDKLSESLAFLYQLDLKIVLVLGNSVRSKSASVDLASLQSVKRNDETLVQTLMQSFSKYQIRAMPVFNSMFKCENSSQNEYTGQIVNVNSELLQHCFQTQQIPIVTSIGENTNTNQYLYIETNHVISSLATQLNPFKIIKLTKSGGLRDSSEKLILNINISKNADSDEMARLESYVKTLQNTDPVNLVDIKELLLQMPAYTSYVVTNINDMIAELFTNSGRGTFFKISESVRTCNDLAEFDLSKAKALIEKSFNKKLKDDYIEKLMKRHPVIFYTESYSALAIIIRDDNEQYAYLDKFCVAPENQGHGLADLLWDSISKECDTLFWRSRLTNPINWWYFRRAHGSWKTDKWLLFWYGLSDPGASKHMLNYVNNLEPSFSETTPVESL